MFLGLKKCNLGPDWWSVFGSSFSAALRAADAKPSQRECSLLPGPVCSLPVPPASVPLAAMFRAFSPGNLPHSHLQALSLLLADGTVLTGVLHLGGNKRNM